MNPIDPAELSAFLDGELEAARAKDVESAIASDPALRMEFERLQKADAGWAAAARSAISQPTVFLASRTTVSSFYVRIAIGAVVLLALRILPKLNDAVAWGAALHSIVLIALLTWVIRSSLRDDVAGDATLSAR